MKIYWKNLIWNHTVRYFLLVKYYLDMDYKLNWPSYYYPHKKFYTKKQEQKFHAEFHKYFKGYFDDCLGE
jgi:hypothetical protein